MKVATHGLGAAGRPRRLTGYLLGPERPRQGAVEPFLQVVNLSKRFDQAVRGPRLTLGVPQGTVLALLGPRAAQDDDLRLSPGSSVRTAARSWDDGADVTARRRCSAVRHGVQHYALFPHLDVGENVGFG